MTGWRALTVQAPWGWAFCHAGKDVENRSWPIPPALLDQPVMLHQGKTWDRAAVTKFTPARGGTIADMSKGLEILSGLRCPLFVRDDDTGRYWLEYHVGPSHWPRIEYVAVPLGAVVAVVEFTGCHPSHDCASIHGSGRLDFCSPWAHGGADPVNPVWHWVAGAVTVLDDPVPARGRQRLWTPDQPTIDAVESQLR